MASRFPEPATPPLVIGAVGGSGTRVVARILRRAGYELGSNLNGSEDALDFRPFYDRWIPRTLAAERTGGLAPAEVAERRREFDAALERHLQSITGELWGWKTPRAIHLLDFLDERFPGMRFIHVVRDGRDMAFSRNQNEVRWHRNELLTWGERWFAPLPLKSILLWDRINRRAGAFARERLRERYFRLRFEDVCRDPVESTNRMLAFLGLPPQGETIGPEEVKAPSSLGRWRKQPARMVARLEAAAGETLREFGYLPMQ